MEEKTVNQNLYEKLREMKLPVMVEEYKNQCEDINAPVMSYEQFSISFILAVLYDRFQNKMKIEDTDFGHHNQKK